MERKTNKKKDILKERYRLKERQRERKTIGKKGNVLN